MGFSEREAAAVAGCCTLEGFSWHCSQPELDLGGQVAAVAAAVADCGVVRLEAAGEAGSFLAAVAAVNVGHQCSLTPCRTSSAPPQVVTCDAVAS